MRGAGLGIARRTFQVQSVVIYQAHHCYRDLRIERAEGKSIALSQPHGRPSLMRLATATRDAHPAWRIIVRGKPLRHLQQVPCQRGTTEKQLNIM